MALSIEEKFERLLNKFIPKIMKAINIDYGVGSAISITNAKIQGKKTVMNPLSLNKQQQQTNIDTIEMLIKDVNQDVAKKINYLVNKSITSNWDTKMLSEELKKLFDKEIPGHFDYKNRFKTIATTESFRIMNESADITARKLGASKKYLFNIMDKKTGEDSKIAEEKYGGEDKAIPIDEPFKYIYKGKIREFMKSPDRQNDRSMTYYLFD